MIPDPVQASCGVEFGLELIRDLAAGTLKRVATRDGDERFAELYLVFADREQAGPATVRLAEILREQVAAQCRLTKAGG